MNYNVCILIFSRLFEKVSFNSHYFDVKLMEGLTQELENYKIGFIQNPVLFFLFPAPPSSSIGYW
jgi:hypothetical protein